MADPVTIKFANHHEMLINGLWNCFQYSRCVDFDIRSGGQTLSAHRLILELFLNPETLSSIAHQMPCEKKSNNVCLNSLLEFIYKGEVTVEKGHLNKLLHLARESEFQFLVDAVEAIEVKQRVAVKEPVDKPNCHYLTSLDVNVEQVNVDIKPDVTDMIQTVRPCCVLLEKLAAPTKLETNFNTENVPNVKIQTTSPSEKVLNDSDISHVTGANKKRVMDPNLLNRNIEIPKFNNSKVRDLPDVPVDLDDGVIGSCSVAPKQFLGTVADQIGIDKNNATPRQLLTVRTDPEKPYPCHLCKKSFRNTGSCSRHLNTVHSVLKPFQCSYCPKSFARMDHLTKHNYIHTGKSNFKCSKCSKCCVSQYVLNNHLLSHAGLKRYPCNVCNNQYSNKKLYEAHMKSHSVNHLEPISVLDFCPSTSSEGLGSVG